MWKLPLGSFQGADGRWWAPQVSAGEPLVVADRFPTINAAKLFNPGTDPRYIQVGTDVYARVAGQPYGRNLVRNWDFVNPTPSLNWFVNNVTFDGGAAVLANSSDLRQEIDVVEGKTYLVEGVASDVVSNPSIFFTSARDISDDRQRVDISGLSNGAFSFTSTVTSPDPDNPITSIRFGAGSSSSGKVSAISIRERLDEPLAFQIASGGWYLRVGRGAPVKPYMIVRIPTDYRRIQTALDALKNVHVPSGQHIVIYVEAGHQFVRDGASSIIFLNGGDWSKFWITAADGEVKLGSEWSTGGRMVRAENQVKMPVWDLLLDGDRKGLSGYYGLNGFIDAFITPEAGTKRVRGGGFNAIGNIKAERSVWTECCHEEMGGSAFTLNGGYADLSDGDVRGSGYYGAQAAQGGDLSFRGGKADDVQRYGMRATNAGKIDARETRASRCTRGVYGFRGGWVNGTDAIARACTLHCIASRMGSNVMGDRGDFSGGLDVGAFCQQSSLSIGNANCQKGGTPSSDDIVVSRGGSIYAHAAEGGTNVTVNTLTASGIIFSGSEGGGGDD